MAFVRDLAPEPLVAGDDGVRVVTVRIASPAHGQTDVAEQLEFVAGLIAQEGEAAPAEQAEWTEEKPEENWGV